MFKGIITTPECATRRGWVDGKYVIFQQRRETRCGRNKYENTYMPYIAPNADIAVAVAREWCRNGWEYIRQLDAAVRMEQDRSRKAARLSRIASRNKVREWLSRLPVVGNA